MIFFYHLFYFLNLFQVLIGDILSFCFVVSHGRWRHLCSLLITDFDNVDNVYFNDYGYKGLFHHLISLICPSCLLPIDRPIPVTSLLRWIHTNPFPSTTIIISKCTEERLLEFLIHTCTQLPTVLTERCLLVNNSFII